MQDPDSSVTHQKVLHYRTFLAKEANKARQQVILKLLVEEEAKDMSNEWTPWQEVDGP